MRLSSVWTYMTPTVQRAFRRAARNSDRVDTRRLLGALAGLTSDDEGGEVLRQLRNEADVNLPEVSAADEVYEGPPETIEVSPTVRETLNFFRFHHMRPIDSVTLSLRLLEIGAGEIVKALEADGRLKTYRQRLRSLRDGTGS